MERCPGKLHTLNLSGRIFHSGHHPHPVLRKAQCMYILLVTVSYYELRDIRAYEEVIRCGTPHVPLILLNYKRKS